MSDEISPLQKMRLKYQPVVPDLLKNLNEVSLKSGKRGKQSDESLRKLFPKTIDQSVYQLAKGKSEKRSLCIGVVFSGGQAAGGHNVIAGVWDGIQQIDRKSRLIGFFNGPSGIINNQWRELKEADIAKVRNLGGFDLIGSGRTKIETAKDLEASLRSSKELNLDGLIVIGGDDSNTNAAILAEYFIEKQCKTQVIGVPKTIDGDLRSEDIDISFGFDSACKTYAELIGAIARDALSAKKYYHFIKLMGRSASHIALECALATQPNLTLIGEERKGLDEIVQQITDLVCRRQLAGKEYGVILIPEGLIEFMPEMKALIQELNQLLAENKGKGEERLSEQNRKFFAALPENIQKQLLFERDPHGNVSVSQIATEQLLVSLVKSELKKRNYQGKFSALEHFFGYEGRSCFPSNFDANYCYALGLLSAVAVRDRATGMICAIRHLAKKTEEWELKMVPLVQLIHMEMRKGKEKPVIKKSLVDINRGPYVHFCRFKKNWEIEDHYRYPGPMQFFGEMTLTDSVPITLTV